MFTNNHQSDQLWQGASLTLRMVSPPDLCFSLFLKRHSLQYPLRRAALFEVTRSIARPWLNLGCMGFNMFQWFHALQLKSQTSLEGAKKLSWSEGCFTSWTPSSTTKKTRTPSFVLMVSSWNDLTKRRDPANSVAKCFVFAYAKNLEMTMSGLLQCKLFTNKDSLNVLGVR